MKVSVIVPIYKAENYLRRCLDSILVQTLTDFELLLIDDGSPDGCGEICDEYACKDSRITVFHKENGGVASARQLGMDNAQGEYIIHADPDDWVEPTMLEGLYNEAKRTDADVVICDYWVNNDHVVKQQPSVLDNLTILQELLQQLHGSCCNKLVKRACCKQYQIQFHQELTYCEDLTFWIRLYQHPVRTSYLPEAYYHYIKRQGSNCKTHMAYKEDRDWKLIKIIRHDLKDYPSVKKMALSRLSTFIIEDAFRYGNHSSFSFTKRYCKYVPFMMGYQERSLSHRLFLARVCLGMYGYYKKRIKYQG